MENIHRFDTLFILLHSSRQQLCGVAIACLLVSGCGGDGTSVAPADNQQVAADSDERCATVQLSSRNLEMAANAGVKAAISMHDITQQTTLATVSLAGAGSIRGGSCAGNSDGRGFLTLARTGLSSYRLTLNNCQVSPHARPLTGLIEYSLTEITPAASTGSKKWRLEAAYTDLRMRNLDPPGVDMTIISGVTSSDIISDLNNTPREQLMNILKPLKLTFSDETGLQVSAMDSSTPVISSKIKDNAEYDNLYSNLVHQVIDENNKEAEGARITVSGAISGTLEAQLKMAPPRAGSTLNLTQKANSGDSLAFDLVSRNDSQLYIGNVRCNDASVDDLVSVSPLTWP